MTKQALYNPWSILNHISCPSQKFIPYGELLDVLLQRWRWLQFKHGCYLEDIAQNISADTGQRIRMVSAYCHQPVSQLPTTYHTSWPLALHCNTPEKISSNLSFHIVNKFLISVNLCSLFLYQIIHSIVISSWIVLLFLRSPLLYKNMEMNLFITFLKSHVHGVTAYIGSV